MLIFCTFFLGYGIIINPTYVVSPKGKFMLTHHGYNYTLASRRKTCEFVRTFWRCTLKGSKTRKACKVTVTCYEQNGICRAEFKGVHEHAPKTERLSKKPKRMNRRKNNETEFIL